MPSATSVDRAALAGNYEATPRKDLGRCNHHRARHCLAMDRWRNSWLGGSQLTQLAVRSFDTMTAARLPFGNLVRLQGQARSELPKAGGSLLSTPWIFAEEEPDPGKGL